MDEELREHIRNRADDLVRGGLSRAEAERRARIEFGSVESFKEQVRNVFWETRLENCFRDFRYALRSLRRDRRFALTAIFTLALGIGSTSVVFSVVYNGLLRPFPYKDAARLTTFSLHDVQDAALQEPGRGDRGGFTAPEFLEWRRESRTFEDMIGFMTKDLSLATSNATIQIHAAFVTPNTFQFLGVAPLLGRSIGPDDAKPNAPPVFAMNYRLWKKQFSGDRKILGKSFVVEAVPRTLVAIMPPRFQINPEGSDIWIPTTPNPSDSVMSANAAEPMHFWWPLGRLKPNANLQMAAADLNLIAQRLAKAFPDLYPPQFTIIPRPFVDVVVGNFKGMLYALAAAVAMLLLITCTNVANLLLARATTRRREMAIRTAIGASRSRLTLQLLMESLVLAAAGTVMGTLLAAWGLRGILAVIPPATLPEEAAITLNSTVLLFALGAGVLTAGWCGLVSAFHAMRGELKSALASGGKGLQDTGNGRLRGVLVVAEVALSMVLLSGAGLMARTLHALTQVTLGFDPSHLLVTELSFPNGKYRSEEERRSLFQRLLGNVASSPGVVAAGLTASLPVYGGPGSDIEIPGRGHAGRWTVETDLCSDGLFRTLGIGLVRGRLLTEADVLSARRVTVIDELFAHTFFGQIDPVGQNVRFKVFNLIPDAPHDANFEIVGVVTTTRNHGLRDSSWPQAYLPYTTFATAGANILIREATGGVPIAKQVQDAIWSVDPGISLVETVPVRTYLQNYDFAAPEFGFAALGAFAGIGLVLAAVGIFGLMAYTVSLRTHEIGIRVALGARQSGILKLILSRGFRLVAIGIVIGLFASYVLTRFLAGQIWGIPADDPGAFAAGALLAIFAGLTACFLPAWRATKVDPIAALRCE